MTLTSELIRLHRLDQRRHGLAESSIDKRVRLLGHLAARLDPAGLLDADTETLEAWLDTLPLKPKTRYTYVSNLHSFYAWAVAAGHLEADPTASMARPKFPPGRPRPILDDDLAVALDMADPTTAVIVACAAYAGMRCCEIARLTRSDVILGGEGHLWAHGKGGKSRQIPLHPELAAILDRFGMPRSGPILRTGAGRPWTAWKVSQHMNGYLHGLGIEATAHQLRHWFATKLFKTSGHNLLLVSELLGHASIITTQIYAATDREGAYAAVAGLAV